MVDDVQFYIYTLLAVIVLSIIVGFLPKKYYIMPLVTLVVMTILAFVLPNFYPDLDWQPLLGYAVFLTLLSLAISVSMWITKRNRRKAKEVRNAEKVISKAEEKEETHKRWYDSVYFFYDKIPKRNSSAIASVRFLLLVLSITVLIKYFIFASEKFMDSAISLVE